MGREADRDTENTKTEEATATRLANKVFVFLQVSALQNCTHFWAQEHICCLCFIPQSQKRWAVLGNKGTCVVKMAVPDLDWRASLFEKLFLWLTCHSSRVARSGQLWDTPPSQPEDQQCQPPTGRCHSHAYHNLGVKFATVPPCLETNKCSLLKVVSTTIQMIYWGSFSLWRRGLLSRNPEEPGRRQSLLGLHMCYLPCRLLNN